MQARAGKARGGGDSDAPARTEAQQRALDAIRRQLDAEFGEGEHPGRSASHDAGRRRRPTARRSRRGGAIGALVVAGFALGAAAGTLATALYLKAANPAPVSGRPESPERPARADREAPAEPEPAPPAPSPPAPAVSAGPAQPGPDVRKDRPPSVRGAEPPALPPRPSRPAPARPRSPSEPNPARDIQSR